MPRPSRFAAPAPGDAAATQRRYTVSSSRRYVAGRRGLVALLSILARPELVEDAVKYRQLGARKSSRPERMRRLQDAFLAPFAVLDFDRTAADHYADIRLHLQRMGSSIGERDQLIAATCRAHHLTLVNGNLRELGRVPDLAVVDRSAS